ncbi:hypothetical protein HYH02_011839 [Chlamydomonas schloesseri]|uniref:Uncharacterized protein n=1 Tax=Chlamydomonas schloesseri TaxID=2026947 RepID=A0A835TCP5_9CHLO|nr:hypothetical protein HYH02_011839 [Chlamydomonas schloesseri]|eukprot:KAG2435545.1 hypothetical protein HYH02_011839 [Chlamydomonas schloesseri]
MQRDINRFVKKAAPPARESAENRDASGLEPGAACASKGLSGGTSGPGGGGAGLLKLLNRASSRKAAAAQPSEVGAPRAALLRVLENKPVPAAPDRTGAVQTRYYSTPSVASQARPCEPVAGCARGGPGQAAAVPIPQRDRPHERPVDAADRYWECYRRETKLVCGSKQQLPQQQLQLENPLKQQPVVVLGGSSKRAAMKRAGLDSARLQEIREVRARIETSNRYNYYTDGGGLWDSEMVGIDGADDVGMRWEGVGCTTTGPRL